MTNPDLHAHDRVVFYSPLHQFAIRIIIALLTAAYLYFIPEHLRILARWQILVLFMGYVPFHIAFWRNFHKKGATVTGVRIANGVDLASSGLMIIVDPYPIPVTMLLLLIAVLGNGFQHGLANFFFVARNALVVLAVVIPSHYLVIEQYPPYPFYFFLCLLFACTFYIHALVRRIEDLVNHTETMALTDELTGLGNRRSFHQSASYLLSMYKRTRLPLVLVYADLDDFKQVNDEYGHAAGDKILKTLADLIRKNFRKTDIAARYGGDEFIFLLVDSTSKGAEKIMERLEQQFIRHTDWLGFRIGISWGVQEVSMKQSDLESLLKEADRLLYETKSEKRKTP